MGDIAEMYDHDFEEDEERFQSACIRVIQTPKAWLIATSSHQAWFPKSVCTWEESNEAGTQGTIIWPEWLEPQWKPLN